MGYPKHKIQKHSTRFIKKNDEDWTSFEFKTKFIKSRNHLEKIRKVSLIKTKTSVGTLNDLLGILKNLMMLAANLLSIQQDATDLLYL